ncbi:hypothetical protein [Deltalipothrixvirus pozzuoliense]|uniref:Uncharacterized protein ORF67a n=1 Tax=Acidianus filamentous virus 2 (isolate Italy/Pozzuoli) TaxID=654910 RepID=Y067A_AFV2P|nr:hypothetical protein AFV2_gp23 [Acidianus filamentous virus 2]Q573E6.1 RecName: Full=Uncharacterized protein ORF67a [Acidianus filamentous virus 2 (isolate Pozzuoli)]CAH69410.1 hypothetical protein [Acidianus filamentous virus 2]
MSYTLKNTTPMSVTMNYLHHHCVRIGEVPIHDCHIFLLLIHNNVVTVNITSDSIALVVTSEVSHNLP